MKSFPYSWLSFIMVIALVVPFGLKKKSSYLEPYPAIIFPAGAGKINLNQSNITFNQSRLWGKKPDGSWKQVRLKQFFSPIPIHYKGYIAGNSFGLKPRPQKWYGTPFGKLSLPKKVTSDDIHSYNRKLVNSAPDGEH